MDNIVAAIERAKASKVIPVARPPSSHSGRESAYRRDKDPVLVTSPTELDPAWLERNRIFGHNALDQRSRPLDLIRTAVSQDMEGKGWRTLGITSPGPGCGKTFTALNLSLSLARQRQNKVLLVDLDIARPQVARRLGLTVDRGIRHLLDGRATVAEATKRVTVGSVSLDVIGCERSTSRPSDWLASENVTRLLEALHASDSYRNVILDLAPVLSGDEAVSILPYIDCAMLVVAVGTTTTTELRECSNHVRTPIVRVLLNKDNASPASYY